jgi:hypothetical protein
MFQDRTMIARKTMWGIATMVLVAAIGCGGSKTKANDPDEPAEPYTNPLLEGGDEPPTTSMENQSGLILESSPPGMEVKVDGSSRGNTPVTVENLSEGDHEVVFVDPKEGDVTYTVYLPEAQYLKKHHAQSPNASDAKMGQ